MLHGRIERQLLGQVAGDRGGVSRIVVVIVPEVAPRVQQDLKQDLQFSLRTDFDKCMSPMPGSPHTAGRTTSRRPADSSRPCDDSRWSGS